MSRTVQGIAAVLHKPMQGKPAKFGAPGPLPCSDDAAIVYRRARVGEVQALWIEGDRVHWIGLLNEQPLQWSDMPTDRTIPLPEPSVRDLISARRLIGVPALTGARAEREDGCMVLEGWTVSRMELLTPEAAPWPGLELNLR